MKQLTQLIKSLKPHEVKLIRNYYRNNKRRNNESRLKLFNTVYSDKKFNKNISNSNLSHLKNRLENDILNIIVSQKNETIYETEFAKNSFLVKKEILQAELLLARGAYLKAIKLLNILSQRSLKYELFEERVKINDMLRSHLAAKHSKNRFGELTKEIEIDLKKLRWFVEAKNCYLIALTQKYFSSRNDEVQHIEYYSRKLNRLYRISKSHRIGMLFYVVRVRQFMLKHSYKLALREAEIFRHLISESLILNTKANNMRILIELSNILFNLKEYSKGYKYGVLAIRYGNRGMISEIRLIEQLFLISFQERNLSRTNKHLIEGLNHAVTRNESSFVHARWLFYRSAFLFLKKQYKLAAKELDELVKRDFKKEEYSWVIGFKLLRMMIDFELNLEEEGLRKLIYFKKYLFKYKIKDRRVKSISKILTSYNRTVNHNITYKKHKDLFKLLKEGRGEYYWNPMGYEIIRFDEWFMAKVNPRNR